MKDRDPGIKLHPHPTFENRRARLGALPDLNLRWAFVGTSGSGKGVAMLDLLLRHYRGVFDRIYLYSKSSTIDKNWDPLRRYVEKDLGVIQEEEKTFFDEFDAQALQEQMDLQMQVAEEAKKQGMKFIPQVLWIIDDLADDPSVMHSNSNLIATLAIRSRHFGGNLWIGTQRFRAMATVLRINLTALFIWPALSNRMERKAIIEEISGHYSPDQIEELLQHVSMRPHGFLFVNLKATDPSEMFQDSLVQKLRVTKKHGNVLDDADQQPGPARADAVRDDR
jgi:ABC-type dipeptide/oligopeptide/nickel transport system ATPase component